MDDRNVAKYDAHSSEITKRGNVNSATGKPYRPDSSIAKLGSYACKVAQTEVDAFVLAKSHPDKGDKSVSSPRRDNSPSIESSEYTRSVATSVENLSEVMDATNSSRGGSSEYSSVSNTSVKPIAISKMVDNTKALLKKKSLVQVINNYIKAGIAEGKRQAKRYIRKALSFGVTSGYLIPADSKGQVIRVSPMLTESRRSDMESRKRRRNARRGEDSLITGDIQHRQLTPPWTTKKMSRREDSPKPETSPQKKKKRTQLKSPERSQKKKIPKKKPVDRVLWRSKKSKKNKSWKKSKMASPSLGLSKCSPSKSEENVQEMRRTRSSCKQLVERKQDQGDRRAKSPRARVDEDESARKNIRGSSNEDRISGKLNGNEVSERISIGRRKSTTSREDVPRNMNPPSWNLAREVEELRRRKPNIPSLVYKFLSLNGCKRGGVESSRGSDAAKCRVCKRPKQREEVLDSLDSRLGDSMANKRKDTGRNSKIRRVERRRTSRDQTLSSCVHGTNGGEGVRKMKRYIHKAIDFGVESGYLIPKDAAYKVLRVSSDLMNDGNYSSKLRKSDSMVSQAGEKSSRYLPIRSPGGEEVVDIENDDEYNSDAQGEKRKSPDKSARNGEKEQLNQSDGEKTTDKKEDDGSDMSMDEDESDVEEEKKREDATKS
ncbi:hypothetical protein WN48_10481 [Eufriesea mexicana]|uniref:Uncharacterized protein n=1 Tax=Eufriesea mexicana TaxID=516756 RepID=A0A310S6N3_9HYME|nr:hypothetical protein WN48_10481 [Eufriesea mexicana]